MRIQHRYLTFDKNDKLTRLLNKLTVKYSQEEKRFDATTHFYALEFYLYEDNPRFSEIVSAIAPFKLEPDIGTTYEKDDIDNAEWFYASTGSYQYPQPESNFGYLTKTFNLDNYCNLCGIGKKQIAPYRLKTEPKQYNNQFWGLHWEFEAIFVREETKRILEKDKIKAVQFSNPVINKNGTPIEGFYQLHIDTLLDKGFDCYNTQIITCKINNEEDSNTDPNLKCCGSIKQHHPMIGGYLFDRSIFNTDFDIVESNEYFGSGGSAGRIQIVSKRFKEIVDKHKLKGLSFTPIMHKRFKR